MKAQTITEWIFLLVIIDQAIKIIIHAFFLETRFEIIPSLLEFKPTFNSHYSYFNSLLYNKYHIDIGLYYHIILYIFAETAVIAIYVTFKSISKNTKFLDIAFIFQLAGIICVLIGSLIWEKGTLDYIYLKPLFVFDLKDIYLNCFAVFFLISAHKNKTQMKTVRMKDIPAYVKNWLRCKKINRKSAHYQTCIPSGMHPKMFGLEYVERYILKQVEN